MLLQLHNDIPMKRVYTLEEELKLNPQRIALTQALTLNAARPQVGLSGKYGLFGSPEWWDNIRQRNMPLLFLSGVIESAYVAGQDHSDFNNTIDLRLKDGTVQSVGIYVNNPDDADLFQVGHLAEIVYALDELKMQPARDGGVNYSRVALEMAVSLQPLGSL